jgi:hypothetical protein
MACAHAADSRTDGQLLTRFLAGRDEEAFAALVRRHGPMVYGAAIKPARANGEILPDFSGRLWPCWEAPDTIIPRMIPVVQAPGRTSWPNGS